MIGLWIMDALGSQKGPSARIRRGHRRFEVWCREAELPFPQFKLRYRTCFERPTEALSYAKDIACAQNYRVVVLDTVCDGVIFRDRVPIPRRVVDSSVWTGLQARLRRGPPVALRPPSQW